MPVGLMGRVLAVGLMGAVAGIVLFGLEQMPIHAVAPDRIGGRGRIFDLSGPIARRHIPMAPRPPADR